MPDCVAFDASTAVTIAADDVAVLFGKALLARCAAWMPAILKMATIETGLEREFIIPKIRQFQHPSEL